MGLVQGVGGGGDSFERSARTQQGSLSPCPFKAEMPHLSNILLSETQFPYLLDGGFA